MADLTADHPPGNKRSVHFSELSELTFTEPSTQEKLAATWYSRDEKEHLKTLLRNDVSRLSRKLAMPMQMIPQEDIYESVGLEVSHALAPFLEPNF